MAAKIDIVKPDGSVLPNVQGTTVNLLAGKYTFRGIKSSVGIGFTDSKGNWKWLESPAESQFSFGPFDIVAGEYYVHNMKLDVVIKTESTTPTQPPVPVTPPTPTTPPTNKLKVSVPYVHHVSVTGNDPHTRDWPWQNGTRGFNTAYLIALAGDYTMEGTAITAVDDRKKVIASGTVLPDVVESNVCLVLKQGVTYTLNSGNITLKSNSMLCVEGWDTGKKAKIYAGPGTTYLITAQNNTVVAGIEFDSPEIGPEKGGPDCVLPEPNANVAVINCRFYNVNYGVNGNRKPAGVLVQGCEAMAIDSIKSYFCWVEGTNWVIRDCKVPNSTREHCIRISGAADKILVHDCELTNVGASVSKIKDDVGKGTLVLQYCTRAYAYNLKVAGPIGTGPLSVDPSKKNERSSYIVVEDSEIKGTFDIHHGASNVRLTRLKMVSDGLAGIVIDDYSEVYQRGTSNVLIEACEVEGRYFGIMNPTGVLNNETPTGFVRIGDKVNGITLKGNTLTSKYMRVSGWGGPSVVFIGNDVVNFKSTNNNWPMASFMVKGQYLSVTEWAKYGSDKVIAVSGVS